MKISVLTPTYNRAHTLPNLYNSLIKNKDYCSEFEWLIMDDGSTDDTEALVKKWFKEDKINIRYFKQENQGKMAALNNLLEHINGEITIECDSDDYFTDTCFKAVLEKWENVEKDKDVYGMAFLKITPNGKPVGNTFKKENFPIKIFDLYFKDGFVGDTCLIFKSDIRKKYQHYLENGEKFITEGRMYHQMDLDYKGIKCFNIPGVVCEYLNDGYTKNILDIFKKSPYGYYKYYLEMFNFDMKGMPFGKRLHIIKHYILFSYLTKQGKTTTIKLSKGIINKILVSVLVIPGYIVTKKKFNG